MKLEAIGYGFLVPIFFVASGVRLDLSGLIHAPGSLLRVPIFLLALLLARGVPALLYVRTHRAQAVGGSCAAAGDFASVHRDGHGDRCGHS